MRLLHSFHWPRSLEFLADFVFFSIAIGFRDAADILLVFEAGLMLTEMVSPRSRYKSVVVVSKDHFATRLKEILCSKKVTAHHVCNYDDLKPTLKNALS